MLELIDAFMLLCFYNQHATIAPSIDNYANRLQQTIQSALLSILSIGPKKLKPNHNNFEILIP
jgi:hypothetical protein